MACVWRAALPALPEVDALSGLCDAIVEVSYSSPHMSNGVAVAIHSFLGPKVFKDPCNFLQGTDESGRREYLERTPLQMRPWSAAAQSDGVS